VEKSNKSNDGNVNDADFDRKGLLFAKADAAGDVGKRSGAFAESGRCACICFIPKRTTIWPTLSISNMPSKKLVAAIDLLESGLDWDSEATR